MSPEEKVRANMTESYETQAKGIRILPGQWRPHYQFEQIAWISPPWPSQDYIWLDFPEAIFTKSSMLYLSHVNPAVPGILFPDLPRVPWKTMPNGISFERILPNGIAFGGSVTNNGDSAASLELHIHNGSDEPLEVIRLQTCAYLRGIKEFSDFTSDNKLVHVKGSGWMRFHDALESGAQTGGFRLGWRSGPSVADLPVMATLSNKAERLAAITWYDDTYSLIENPLHPCMHADPAFPDLEPGESAEVRGALLFFEGPIDQFTDWFRKRSDNR